MVSYHLTWHVDVNVLLNIEVKVSQPLWDNDLLLSVTRHPGFNFHQRNRVMSHEKIRKTLDDGLLFHYFIIFLIYHYLRSVVAVDFTSLSSIFFHFTLLSTRETESFYCVLFCVYNRLPFHVISFKFCGSLIKSEVQNCILC